jgi:hypothetical protein
MSSAALPTPAPGAASLGRTLRVEWERVLAWALIGVAPVALLWGWQHLAGSPFGSEEVAYLISGGLTALVFVLGGVAGLITADLRDEHYKLDRLEAAVWGETQTVEVARWWAVRLAAVLAVALAFVIAGWSRAAGTGHLSVALDGLALAAIGPFLAALGLTGHGALARREVVRRRNVVLGHLRVSLGVAPSDQDGREHRPEPLWTASGLRRLHRRDCAALASAGAPVVPATDAGPAAELCQLCHRGNDARA